MKMHSWYNTPEKIAKLKAAADSWIGTPFGQNGCVKGPGGGVSCQMLSAAIQIETGAVEKCDPPRAPMNWARHNKTSLVEPYMDRHPRFSRLGKADVPEPGDILGFKLGGCVHHMATFLGGGMFIHVFENIGVFVASLHEPTYSKRLSVVWRPLP